MIKNCIISKNGNHSSNSGGIAVSSRSEIHIINNTIVSNRGSGIYWNSVYSNCMMVWWPDGANGRDGSCANNIISNNYECKIWFDKSFFSKCISTNDRESRTSR